MPVARPAVYLHVGPPKTGTTYLQEVLWLNQRRLAERGLTIPGQPRDHFHAALDVRDIAFGGHHDPDVQGSWSRLAGRARQVDGKVVISHEVLAGARTDQIGTAVASLAPARVHVVYAVRDLARQLPAVWQEGLKNRQTRSFRRFLDRALSPGAALDRGFWRAQHPVQVLARWAQHVPVDQISVLTLPAASAAAPGETLWSRFCQALDVDGSGLDLRVARTNASLSAAQCEVLRRLNKVVPEAMAWPEYERIVKRRFNLLADTGDGGRRIQVPARLHDTVRARSEEIVAGLREAGYRVVGDLEDVFPEQQSFGRASVKPTKVVGAAVAMLADELTASAAQETVRTRARSLIGRLQARGSGHG